MFRMDLAEEAARRWNEREAERQKTGGQDPVNAEKPERVQARIEHLQFVAAREATRPIPDVGRELVDSIAQERIIGRSDLLGVQFLELGIAVSRFVARVNVKDMMGRTHGYGTGFMVSPRLLMTNNHVLGSPAEARTAVAEFDYQVDRFQRQLPLEAFALEPDTFFLTSPAKELDFTLVAVAERSQSGTSLRNYTWTRLVGTLGKALLNEPLNIIQHPNGQMKQIALRAGELVDLPPVNTFAHYSTDTEPGSSGSPVFNDQWEVVALHHSGVPRMKNGSLIARDGSVWRPNVDPPDALDWVANEGIRVSRLVEFVTQAAIRPSEEKFRTDLLNLEPRHPMEIAEAASAVERREHAGRMVGHRGLSFTVPLRITVEFDDATPGKTVDSLRGDPPAPRSVIPSPPPPPPPPSPEEVFLEKLVQPVIDTDYSTRRGYDEHFLGSRLALPKVDKALAAKLEDGNHVVPYEHFSVIVHKKRRIALVTASNVDGSPKARQPEPGRDYTRRGLTGLDKNDQELWLTDARIPELHQLPDRFYTKDRQSFDKGHIVRREDICWGATYAEVRRANGDTYHTTNCSPQIAGFNRAPGDWGSLEDHILKQAKVGKGDRYCIFAGPVLAEDDPSFSGVDDRGAVRIQIPTQYWKIVVTKDGGGLQAFAFVLTQDLSDVPFEEKFQPGPWAMTSVADLEGLLVGITFPDALKAADQSGTQEGLELARVTGVRRLPPRPPAPNS